ncbi:uncharacterized protein LOC128551783 [Mercenaria mercenaria]|uniref:uncharacterized protein LOC128551783 n=1 Tax=Mercenaria mercenaria TaxID=6596 RepID=UPI00234F6816|nr:uncharacterized protein LOC128551783 [Mercenaria mercenaria]XP_053388673.1 uncharacterized protein LOC128551783 [Mercenaria mercenaria]XP_053388674.1 uncharacterized protein LOC128551783 [Mercenaria mercenaria]
MSMSKYIRKEVQCRRVQNNLDDESIALLLSEIDQVREYEHPGSTTQDDTHSSVSCADCAERRRIEKVFELTIGLHIEMPGNKKSKYDEAKRERKSWYTHHAIISNIIARNDSIVEVELIHMAEYENKLQLCKTRRTFDLKYDELYMIHYLFPRYSPTQVVRRAEAELERFTHAHESNTGTSFYKYNIFTSNCEHFATWCVVGKEENYESLQWIDQILQPFINLGYSKQVMYWISKTVEAVRHIFGHGSKAAHFFTKLLHASSDEISEILSGVIPGWLPSARTVLFGASGIYTIYCLCTTVYLYHRKWKAAICEPCFNKQLSNLWAKFSVYGVTSFVTYFMVQGSVNIPVVIGSIGLIVLSIACQYYIPNIRKAFMAPYCCTKKAIRRLKELEIGDIVTLYYFCLPHDVLITEIHEQEDGKKGELRAVHYATDGLFSTRIVKEEYFKINLHFRSLLGWSVQRHECAHLQRFPPEIAVERARKRVGETKWNPVTNRSDHICYWAKISRLIIKEDTCDVSQSVNGKTESALLSSLLIGESDVHLSADIEIGDVVRCREKEGIVLEKSGSEREINLDLALVEGTVKFQNFSINLNTENVQVLAYHPVHCYEKPTRAQRARHLEGQSVSKKVFKDFCILLDA